MEEQVTYTAFVGETRIASGPLEAVLAAVKARFDQDPGAPLYLFDDPGGRQVDFDLRGTLADVLARALPPPAHTGPGRPKLGVVSREISLLPRHWTWLEQQPGGASATLRKLVEEARKRDPEQQRARLARDAACRFLSAMAGNRPGYEEATRALRPRPGSLRGPDPRLAPGHPHARGAVGSARLRRQRRIKPPVNATCPF